MAGIREKSHLMDQRRSAWMRAVIKIKGIIEIIIVKIGQEVTLFFRSIWTLVRW